MILRTPLTLLVLAVLAVALAACGGSGDSAPQAPAGPEPGETLSVEEAIPSASGGPVTVRGYLLAAEGAPVRLCAALAESYPPQCGVASVVVEGLELSTVEGLTTPPEPEYAHTSWTDTEIMLAGELEDGVLTVGEASG